MPELGGLLPANVTLLQPGARNFRLVDALQTLDQSQAIQALQSQIATLQGQIATIQGQITALQAEDQNLQGQINAINQRLQNAGIP